MIWTYWTIQRIKIVPIEIVVWIFLKVLRMSTSIALGEGVVLTLKMLNVFSIKTVPEEEEVTLTSWTALMILRILSEGEEEAVIYISWSTLLRITVKIVPEEEAVILTFWTLPIMKREEAVQVWMPMITPRTLLSETYNTYPNIQIQIAHIILKHRLGMIRNQNIRILVQEEDQGFFFHSHSYSTKTTTKIIAAIYYQHQQRRESDTLHLRSVGNDQVQQRLQHHLSLIHI